MCWRFGNTSRNSINLKKGNGGNNDYNAVDSDENQDSDKDQGMIDIYKKNLTSFIIHPNPTTGKIQLTVSASNSSPAQVFIYDIFGRTIFYSIGANHNKYTSDSSIQTPVAETINIDISNHASGIYFVKVISGEDVFIKKIVLQ